MSRIGKKPIDIPAGIEVKVDKNRVTTKGPKGELGAVFSSAMGIKVADNRILVTRPSDTATHRSLHGLTRSLIQNMVTGVGVGFSKTLEIVGVGYKAIQKGKGIEIAAGYSQPVTVEAVEGIDFEVPIPTKVIISGVDRQLVGEVAAKVRAIRPPEPYKGKGIKYADEHIRRKVGKTAK